MSERKGKRERLKFIIYRHETVKNTLNQIKLSKIFKQNSLYFPFSAWNSYSQCFFCCFIFTLHALKQPLYFKLEVDKK